MAGPGRVARDCACGLQVWWSLPLWLHTTRPPVAADTGCGIRATGPPPLQRQSVGRRRALCAAHATCLCWLQVRSSPGAELNTRRPQHKTPSHPDDGGVRCIPFPGTACLPRCAAAAPWFARRLMWCARLNLCLWNARNQLRMVPASCMQGACCSARGVARYSDACCYMPTDAAVLHKAAKDWTISR